MLTLSFSMLTVAADAKVFNVDIQSKNTSKALMELADLVGVQIIVPQSIGVSTISPNVAGYLTVEQALNQILDNTGLSYAFTSDNMIVVREQSNAGAKPDSGKDKAKSQIEEVVVTATKRDTTLQDTAMSVTAVGGEMMDKLGVTNIGQIIDTVPGVTYISNGAGSKNISLRGVSISSLVGAHGVRAFTSTYLNDFPLGLGTPSIGMVDIERLEVIKGPQGTLYGQSAMGGVIRYITRQPNTERFEGGAKTSISSTEDGSPNYGGSAYLNVPISDSLAARAVVYDYLEGGIVDNAATGEEDVNGSELRGGRFALRWTPTEKASVDVLLMANSTNQKARIGSGGNTAHNTYTPSASGPLDVQPIDPENPQLQNIFPGYRNTHDSVFNLKFSYDFDDVSLSVMGARKNQSSYRYYNSAAWYSVYDDVTMILSEDVADSDTITFETRLVSTGDGPFEWIAGLWYEDMDGLWAEYDPVKNPAGTATVFGTEYESGEFLKNYEEFRASNELAGYGEVGYRFTDDLKLSLGFRRSRVELDQGVDRASGVFDGGRVARIGADESVSETVNTYRANLEYTVNDDILAYATVSSGYRAGGYNAGGLLTSTSRYGSDSIWNYELGMRTSWLDRRLTANLFLYYLDWSDIQITQWDNVALAGRTQNAGKAEVNGAELELSYIASDNLTIYVNYSLIDASFVDPYIYEGTGEVRAEAGSQLPGSSKHTFSTIVDWQNSITSNLDLVASANFRYIAGRRSELGWGLPDVEDYELLNLKLGVLHNDGFGVSLFADNALDKRVIFNQWIWASQLTASMMNTPRTVGLRFEYDF